MKNSSNNSSRETVLITGASKGIGFALAHQFAKHGHPLIIVSQDDGEIQAAAVHLMREYGVSVKGIAKDLTQENAADELYHEATADGGQVEILVNNAGRGMRGKSWEIPIETDLEIVRLNIEAVLRLTKKFLPPMLERGHGRILNTASVAGFEPGPLLAVYHASKAFVLSWSESLATELADTGITVTALCPGPVDTDFFVKADMLDTKVFQSNMVMAPDPVAEAGFKALMDGERVIVPGINNKALVWARRVTTESMQATMNEKMYESVPPEDVKKQRGDVESKDAASHEVASVTPS